MAWHGDEIRHSLARRGIRLKRTPWDRIYDVRGLDELVNSYVSGLGVPKNASQTVDFGVDFCGSIGWEPVIDASKLLSHYDSNSRFEKRRNNSKKLKDSKKLKAAIMSAPLYILSYDNKDIDSAYVFVGRGGTFVHPSLTRGGKPYKDNNYLNPIAYLGSSIVFKEPVTLYAMTKEPDTREEVEIPFKIAGLVGLEDGINSKVNETARVRTLEPMLATI